MATISVSLKPSHRQSVLAAVTISLGFKDGTSIEIHDARVMRNRQGVVWAALPTYSITTGKQYEYLPSVILNPTLHRRVTDEILADAPLSAALPIPPITSRPETTEPSVQSITPQAYFWALAKSNGDPARTIAEMAKDYATVTLADAAKSLAHTSAIVSAKEGSDWRAHVSSKGELRRARKGVSLKRCNTFFKKSISIAGCPTLRSNSAMRSASNRASGRAPLPGNASSPLARHSLFHVSKRLGLS